MHRLRKLDFRGPRGFRSFAALSALIGFSISGCGSPPAASTDSKSTHSKAIDSKYTISQSAASKNAHSNPAHPIISQVATSTSRSANDSAAPFTASPAADENAGELRPAVLADALAGQMIGDRSEEQGARLVARLAWILATHPDTQVRDGELAVALASAVCRATDYREPRAVEALAAAYAERGNFKQAISTAQRCRHVLKSESEIDRLAGQLRSYENRLPVRDDPGVPVPGAPEAVNSDRNARTAAQNATRSARIAAMVRACWIVSVQSLEAGDPAVAARLLRCATELNPRYTAAGRLLGKLLVDVGEFPEAIKHLQVAADNEPRNASVWERLGLALQQSGHASRAIASYRRALELRPNWPEPTNNLAWLLATHSDKKLRDPAEALRLLEALADRGAPIAADVSDTQAAAYAQLGEFEKSLACSARAIQLAERDGRSQLVEQFRQRRLFYEARRPYVDGQKLPTLDRMNDSAAHLLLGTQQIRLGQTAAAAGHYEALLAAHPDDPMAALALGTARAQQGHHAEAIELFARVAQQIPGAPEPVLNLAWVLATTADDRLRDAHEALLLATWIAEPLRNQRSVLDTLGVAHAAAGKFDEAIELTKQAVRQSNRQPTAAATMYQRLNGYRRSEPYQEPSEDPPASQEQCAKAHVALGTYALRQGRTDDAIRWLRLAQPHLPNSFDLRYHLGLAWLQQGNTLAAIEALRSALRLDPNRAEAANNLAWALATRPECSNEEASEAIEWAERAVRAEHAEGTWMLHTLACAFAAAGRFDEAIATLEKVAEPSNDPHRRAEAQLDLERFKRRQARRESGPRLMFFEPAYRRVYIQLGRALEPRRPEEALPLLEAALQMKPEPELLNDVGGILQRLGRRGQAQRHFALAAQLGGDWKAINNFAWSLATDPRPEPRDAALAKQLAELACQKTKWKELDALETLAAAYASSGEFERAVQTIREALTAAEEQQRSQLAARLRDQQSLYEAGKPYRSAPP